MTDGANNFYFAPIVGLATNSVGLTFLNGDTNAAQTITTGPGIGITDVGPVHTLSLSVPLLWAITGTTNIFNTNSGNVQISHKATTHAINDPALILTDPTNVFLQIGANSYLGITDFSTGNWTNADAGTLNIVSSNTIIFRTYSSGDWMTKMWLQNNGDLDLTGNYHGGGVTYGVDPGHVHTAYQPVSVNLTNWSNLPTNYVPIWAQNATNALYAGLSTNALEANHSTNSDSATYAGTATNALGGWPVQWSGGAITSAVAQATHSTNSDSATTAQYVTTATLTNQVDGARVIGYVDDATHADSADSGWPVQWPWLSITNAPATYSPSPHNQGGNTITSAVAYAVFATNADIAVWADNAGTADFASSGWPTQWPWSAITNPPSTYAPSAHSQAGNTITSIVNNATYAGTATNALGGWPTIRGLAPGSGISVTTNVNDWVVAATGTGVSIAAGTNITVTTNGSICTVSTHPELNLDDNVSTIFNVNPGQVFTLAPQDAHKVLIGPTGGSAVPTMRLLEASDIPTVTYALYSLYGTAHILGSTNHTDVSFTTLQDGDLIVRSGSSWVNSSNYTGVIKLYSDLRPNSDGGTALGAPDKRFSGIYGQGLDILGDATLLGSTHIGGSNGVTYGVSIDGPVGTAVKADIGTAPQPFGNINCTNLSSTLVQAGSRLVIPVSASAPSTPAEGTLYFDTALAKLRIYIGSGWTNVGP